jgi:hypothetical protein
MSVRILRIGGVVCADAVPAVRLEEREIIPVASDAALIVSAGTQRAHKNAPLNRIASELAGSAVWGRAVLCGISGDPDDPDLTDVPLRFYGLLQCNEEE